MNKVYRHRPRSVDEFLGRVDANGKTYESRLGPDQYIGRVDLETGRIYEARPGPDKHIGHIEPETGKVYLDRLGPDQYLGRVQQDGKLYAHVRLGADEYIGRVEEMLSVVHGGAAFLLLVQPAYDEKAAAEKEILDERAAGEKEIPNPDEGETGQAGAPA